MGTEQQERGRKEKKRQGIELLHTERLLGRRVSWLTLFLQPSEPLEHLSLVLSAFAPLSVGD